MNKPQLFQPGQEITPKITANFCLVCGPPTDTPKIGEIYHVGRHDFSDNNWFISLMEMDPMTGYREDGFDPVGNLDEVGAILKEQESPIVTWARNLLRQP